MSSFADGLQCLVSVARGVSRCSVVGPSPEPSHEFDRAKSALASAVGSLLLCDDAAGFTVPPAQRSDWKTPADLWFSARDAAEQIQGHLVNHDLTPEARGAIVDVMAAIRTLGECHAVSMSRTGESLDWSILHD